jgi:hypothetical protein
VLLGQQHPFNLDPFKEILENLSTTGWQQMINKL